MPEVFGRAAAFSEVFPVAVSIVPGQMSNVAAALRLLWNPLCRLSFSAGSGTVPEISGAPDPRGLPARFGCGLHRLGRGFRPLVRRLGGFGGHSGPCRCRVSRRLSFRRQARSPAGFARRRARRCAPRRERSRRLRCRVWSAGAWGAVGDEDLPEPLARDEAGSAARPGGRRACRTGRRAAAAAARPEVGHDGVLGQLQGDEEATSAAPASRILRSG